jgi:hypothetical protein
MENFIHATRKKLQIGDCNAPLHVREGLINNAHGVTDMTTTTIHEVRETYGSDFYVYSGDKLIRVCPSIGMAREVAAAYS